MISKKIKGIPISNRMDEPVYKYKSVRIFTLIYVSALLLSIHHFFIYFTNSSYLNTYVKSSVVGFLFTFGAIVNLFVFLNIGKILNRIGNYKFMLGLIVLELGSLIGLAWINNFYIVALLFIISQALNPLLVFNLDLFLDNYSKDEETGGIRGIFLTMLNIPQVFIPFVAGLILSSSEYWKVYLVAGAFLIPLFYIIYANFREFKDPPYHEPKFMSLVKEVTGNKNVYDILFDNFLLNFFYAWMAIYMPIYLHQYIGFSWPEIGLMFSIMLLPFILFQIPLGRLADKRIGEKEILIIGFVIIAVSTILIPYITEANFLLWTTLLFITRIGASFIEISAESYFFKKVSISNINLMGLFRMTKNLPFIIVPALVSFALVFMDYQYTFIVLGLIMLLGLRYAFKLQDTK